jgi:hypothetical protein
MHSISMLWNVLQPHTKYHEQNSEERDKSTLRTALMWLCFIWQTFKLEFAQQCLSALQKKNKMVKHNQSSLTLKFMSIIERVFFEGRNDGVTSCVDNAGKIPQPRHKNNFYEFCVNFYWIMCDLWNNDSMWYSAGIRRIVQATELSN